MKNNKYSYAKVIQQFYGQGWEDVSEYPTNSMYYHAHEERKNLKSDLSNYRLMGYPTRVIKRRELNK